MPDPTETPTPAPAAAAAPAADPPAAKRPPQAQRKGPRMIHIPEAAFKERVARAAAALHKQRTDAEPASAAGAAAAAPAGQAAGSTDEAVKKLTAENARLRTDAAKASKRADDETRRRQKEVQRLKDRQVEAELRMAAVQAGIRDPDYALHLFARAAAGGKAQDPAKFFTELKPAHAFLFGDVVAAPPAPPVVTATPTTAPPESRAPGEAKPNAAPAGAPPAAPNADKMSPHEFAARTRAVYGFTPGM
jgi:hypothetical protein